MLYNRRYETYTYHTLSEVCENYKPFKSSTSILHTLIEDLEFNEESYSFRKILKEVEGEYTDNDYIVELWMSILDRFSSHYVIGSKEKELTTELKREALIPIFNVMTFTYDKYTAILNAIETQRDKLLDQIKSSSEDTTRFNDTPQNYADVPDYYDDDSHTTNITNSKTNASTDGDTPMGRLREIMDNYRNTFLEWTNEFAKCFIEEENLW